MEKISWGRTRLWSPTNWSLQKLCFYGVDVPSSKLLNSNLIKREQRVKLSGPCSSWSEIVFGVPQDFTLRPLLFNIFLFDLIQYFPDLDITNYADDNTFHSTNEKLNKVLHGPEKESNTLFKWLTENLSETNPKKSHLLTNSTQEIQINICGMAISNSKCEKLLGNHIDNKLTFDFHVTCLFKKASQKINAFAFSLKLIYYLKNCIFPKIWAKKSSS